MGMYSAVNLFPDKRAGFVFMINGEGSDARTVLNTALAKLITGPEKQRPISWYADELTREQGLPSSKAPDTSSRSLDSAASLKDRLGIYRDP